MGNKNNIKGAGRSNAPYLVAPRCHFFLGAPGRAHLLGGESPLLARQGEELARGKGFAGDCESEGSPMAKRWPDEQEADMRRRTGERWPNSPKPKTCTEAVRRISDRHKREGGCAIPGEIWLWCP